LVDTCLNPQLGVEKENTQQGYLTRGEEFFYLSERINEVKQDLTDDIRELKDTKD